MVTITAGAGSILWLQKLGASRKTRLERDAFYSRHIPKTHLVWDCGELNKKIERRDTICGRKTYLLQRYFLNYFVLEFLEFINLND